MSQPVDVYPYPVSRSQSESSHSNGSYGPVSIVLPVIFVISIVSCVLGRLCSRQHHHHLPKSNATYEQQSPVDLGPKESEAKEKPKIAADIESGIPSAKVASDGGGMVEPPHVTGGRQPEVTFADNV